MLAMGMTLSLDDFKILLKRPFDIGIGTFAQYFIGYIAGWLMGTIAGMGEAKR